MSVYFARVGRYLKVGYSENAVRRVANLFQSSTRYSRPADCPLDADRELLAVIPGGLNEERLCHQALADFAADSEFFIDEPAVRDFIVAAQAGRFPQVRRPGGPFVPVSRVTDEDRATLHHALRNLFTPNPEQVAVHTAMIRRASEAGAA